MPPPPEEPRLPTAEALPPSPEVSPGNHWQVDASLVEQRRQLYQQKIDEWQAAESRLQGLGLQPNSPDLWRACRQGLELTLAGYQGLQPGAATNPWEVVRQDLDYVSKGCDQLVHQARDGGIDRPTSELTTGQTPDRGAIEAMRQLWATGQYQEVVTSYEALLAQGQAGGGREGQFLGSQALVKLGRLPSALTLLTKLLADGGQGTDLTALEIRRLTADVLLSLGHVDEARQLYEGLARAFGPLQSQQEWVMTHLQVVGAGMEGEGLSVYRELLLAYLRFDGQHLPPELTEGANRLRGQGQGPFAELANLLLAKATAQAQDWARGQLLAIKDLLTAGNLPQARQRLQQLIDVAPATMQPAIDQLAGELAQAEAKATAAPQAPAAEGQAGGAWGEALALFEQQKYDQAIAGFTPFLVGAQEAEARAKIAEASELAAVGMRRQAAALYAKAKKTFDPEARQQGLLSSRALLLALIEKYPESSVVDKARQNLKVLEGELSPSAPTTPAASPSSAPR